MDNLNVIALTGELLSLCGIASIRCFMPTFLVCLSCRFLPSVGLLGMLSKQIPDAMMSTAGLIFLGVLAILELVANWNDTVRDLFSDVNWERYTKPVCAFAFALAVGSPEISGSVAAGVGEATVEISSTGLTDVVVSSAPPESVMSITDTGSTVWEWIWSLISAGLSAFGTSVLCGFRQRLADIIRSIDPDNSLKLQTLACAVEESTWLALLLVALLIPALAIVMMAIFGICAFAVKCVLRALEKRGRHDCPHCSTRVHDSAVKCPHCGKDQPLPYHAVGFRGLAARGSVAFQDPSSVLKHHRDLLREHRCPICAEPLTDKLVCPHCGAHIWEQGVSREDFIRTLDLYMCGGVIGGLMSSAIPIIGFVLTVIFMNMWVLRVIRSYETKTSRIFSRFLFRLAKWMALIVGILLSSIPFSGAIFLLPYVFSYWRSRTRFLR